MARVLRSSIALSVLVTPAIAQSETFETNPIPDLLSSLFAISLTEGISTGTIRIDNGREPRDDTHLNTLHVPWSTKVDVGSSLGTLNVRAIVGGLTAKDGTSVDLDAGEARISNDWLAVGGEVGVGWNFPLAERWYLTPGVGLGLSYTRNDATYNELGEQVLAPLVEGILANWDAWAFVLSTSLTLERTRPLGVLDWGLTLRGAATNTDVFAASSDFQKGSDTGEFVVTRFELGGPTGASVNAESLDWDAFGGWVGLYDLDRASLGFDSFFQIGAGLSLRPFEGLPRMHFGGGVLAGEDVTGWSLGLTLDI